MGSMPRKRSLLSTLTLVGDTVKTSVNAALFLAALSALGTVTAFGASLLEDGGAAPGPNVAVYSKADLRLRTYEKVLIEDVRISYDESSAYKGFTPAQQEKIREAAGAAIRAAIGERFAIATDAGPGVLRVRPAITGVRAEEKKKRFWTYTPFGFVKGRIDAATGKNIALLSATAEIELLDGESGECLAAVIDLNAGYESDAASEEFASFRAVVAKLGGWTHRLVKQVAAPTGAG
jgi:hypothetical protein